MSIITRIKSTIGKTYNMAGGIVDRLTKNVINIDNSQMTPQATPALQAPTYAPKDFTETGGTTFGEASTYTTPDVEMEMRAMVSSVLNRADILKKSPSEIVSIPEQFAAHGGKQYQQYINRDTSEFGAKEKMMMIDNILQEIKDGKFKRLDYTSFNKDPRSGGVKIGSHYFFKEDKFRTK